MPVHREVIIPILRRKHAPAGFFPIMTLAYERQHTGGMGYTVDITATNRTKILDEGDRLEKDGGQIVTPLRFLSSVRGQVIRAMGIQPHEAVVSAGVAEMESRLIDEWQVTRRGTEPLWEAEIEGGNTTLRIDHETAGTMWFNTRKAGLAAAVLHLAMLETLDPRS